MKLANKLLLELPLFKRIPFTALLFLPICLVICIIRWDIVEPASVSTPPLFLPVSPRPAFRCQTHHTRQDAGTRWRRFLWHLRGEVEKRQSPGQDLPIQVWENVVHGDRNISGGLDQWVCHVMSCHVSGRHGVYLHRLWGREERKEILWRREGTMYVLYHVRGRVDIGRGLSKFDTVRYSPHSSRSALV